MATTLIQQAVLAGSSHLLGKKPSVQEQISPFCAPGLQRRPRRAPPTQFVALLSYEGGQKVSKRDLVSRRGATAAGREVGVQEGEEEEDLDEEEEDRRNCATIMNVLEALRVKRNMTYNEAKLTIMIEDPRITERREKYGIEDDSGVSREELGNALAEVYEGGIPQDRFVLRELTKEMLSWPRLEDEEYAVEEAKAAAAYATVTDTGLDPKVLKDRQLWDAVPEPIKDQIEGDDLADKLPPWVGYGMLYGVSAIPVIIGVAVVVILFLNSLS